MAQQLLQRRDTAANWTANDPVLGAGEIGVESDTNTFKIGDGSTAWSALTYFSGGGGGSEITNDNFTFTVGTGGDFTSLELASEFFLANRQTSAWEVSGNGRRRAKFIILDLQGQTITLNNNVGFEYFDSWLTIKNGTISGTGQLVFSHSNVRFGNPDNTTGGVNIQVTCTMNRSRLFDYNNNSNVFNFDGLYMNDHSTFAAWNLGTAFSTAGLGVYDQSVLSLEGTGTHTVTGGFFMSDDAYLFLDNPMTVTSTLIDLESATIYQSKVGGASGALTFGGTGQATFADVKIFAPRGSNCPVTFSNTSTFRASATQINLQGGAISVSGPSSINLEAACDWQTNGNISFGVTPTLDATNHRLLSTTAGASKVFMKGLPTSDPGVAGQLWYDTTAGNVVKVS